MSRGAASPLEEEETCIVMGKFKSAWIFSLVSSLPGVSLEGVDRVRRYDHANLARL